MAVTLALIQDRCRGLCSLSPTPGASTCPDSLPGDAQRTIQSMKGVRRLPDVNRLGGEGQN